MSVISPEIVKSFVELHSPGRIDADYLAAQFGSIAAYLDHKARRDCGRRYIEISARDSITGTPVILDLY